MVERSWEKVGQAQCTRPLLEKESPLYIHGTYCNNTGQAGLDEFYSKITLRTRLLETIDLYGKYGDLIS